MNMHEDTRVEMAVALHEKALRAYERGECEQARIGCVEALHIFSTLKADMHPDMANVLNLVCRISLTLSDYDEALDASERALAMMDHAMLDAAEDEVVARLHVQTLTERAMVHLALGDYDRAEGALLRALETAEGVGNCDGEDLANALNSLGIVHKYQGRYDDAETRYRQALQLLRDLHGPDHVSQASLYHNLGGLDHCRGRFADAEPHARKSVELRQLGGIPEDPEVIADMAALAAILEELGQLEEAEIIYNEVLARYRHLFGDCHYELAFNLGNLGAMFAANGRSYEAEPLLRESLQTLAKLLGESHPEFAVTQQQLAIVCLHLGRPDEAEPLCLQALDTLTQTVGTSHPWFLDCAATLAACRH